MTPTERFSQSISTWKTIWQTQDKTPYTYQHTFTRKEQNRRFKRIQDLTDECLGFIAEKGFSEELMEPLEPMAIELIQLILNVDTPEVTDIMRSTYSEATQTFVEQARAFDPDMDHTSIFQALRNVWIMHSIQVMMGHPPHHTAAIFGYSMLYPLTDNFLDDPNVPGALKRQFNNRFRKRLSGEMLAPGHAHEEGVFEMVVQMESVYPRDQYPDVWNSILLIQEGQEQSLLQQSGAVHPFDQDLLHLSFFKGGSSVLADGYLVCGTLSDDWLHFLTGYGILLQLADDLQDVFEDEAHGHMTLFSLTWRKWRLDFLTNRLFHFKDAVLQSCPCTDTPDAQSLLPVIDSACEYLLYDAVLAAQKAFSPAFRRRIQQHYPLRKGQQAKVKRLWKNAMSQLTPE